ncbi:hypothetical protein Tco_1177823, partial [Tanacetum coccineum]
MGGASCSSMMIEDVEGSGVGVDTAYP